eukprot:429359_1
MENHELKDTNDALNKILVNTQKKEKGMEIKLNEFKQTNNALNKTIADFVQKCNETETEKDDLAKKLQAKDIVFNEQKEKIEMAQNLQSEYLSQINELKMNMDKMS